MDVDAAPSERFNRPWRTGSYMAIDLEGTGWQDGQDEIVELAAVPIDNGRPRSNVLDLTINPGRHIRPFPHMPYRLKDSDVAAASPFEAVRREVELFMRGTIFVAHNARVDWSLLQRKCPGLTPLAVLDTLRLSRVLYPDERHHRLGNLIERLGLASQINTSVSSHPHRALYDAVAVAYAWVTMLEERFPSNGTVEELIGLCAIDLAGPRPRAYLQ